MIRRPPRSTQSRSSAASDVYKRQLGDSIESNARFATGHVKVMTKAYADNIDQMPNDLALLKTDSVMTSLRKSFPGLSWAERIHFAGLIDVPDASGETRSQGTILGFGIDLLSGD